MSTYSTEIINAVASSAGRKRIRSHGLRRIFAILLFAVFIVVDLLALVAGTSSYGSITRMQAANDRRIMSLGPIISSVRANDVDGGVSTGEGPEGDALVLIQHDALSDDSYETRIYLHQGKIVQEYALGGSPYNPSHATPLADSSTFEFSHTDGLLVITTDAGVAKVALRNRQGGA